MALRSELNETELKSEIAKLGNSLQILAAENDKSIDDIMTKMFDDILSSRKFHHVWHHMAKSALVKEYKNDLDAIQSKRFYKTIPPFIAALQVDKETQQKLVAFAAFRKRRDDLDKEVSDLDKISEEQFSAESQKKIEALKIESAKVQSAIRVQLGNLLPDKNLNRNLAELNKEFIEKLKLVDREVKSSASTVDTSNFKMMADVYDKLDSDYYNLINETAQRAILISLNEFKLSLMVRLSFYTDYDLSKAQELSDIIIEDILSQFKNRTNTNIRFEKLAKQLDDSLDPGKRGKYFGALTTSIREEYMLFTEKSAFLYNALYDAKKFELTQIECFNKFDAWRKETEENMISFMLKHINRVEFHNKFVYIAMEENQAKQDPERSIDIQALKDATFQELNAKITQTYHEFFRAEKISENQKMAFNEDRLKEKFFRSVTSDYLVFKNSKPLNNGARANEILEVISQHISGATTTLAASKQDSAKPTNFSFKSNYKPQLFNSPKPSKSADAVQHRVISPVR